VGWIGDAVVIVLAIIARSRAASSVVLTLLVVDFSVSVSAVAVVRA
jgi:hypothetical protein